MIINYRVSRDFANYPDSDLDEFTNNIVSCLTGNLSFPAPVVVPTAVAALDTVFRDAIANATGDPMNTVIKLNARTALLNGLRKNASYVESLAHQDLAMLLSSGYYASSTNRAPAPLDIPSVTDFENLMSTQFLLRLSPVTNAKSYQVQISVNGSGTWTDAGIFGQAKRIVLTGLVPGTIYIVRARAIGGSTGYSDWSISAPLMAT